MIKLQKLEAGYKAKNPVLKEVSLTLRESRIYGLLGSNGSGKTTLLNTLAGVLHPLGGGIDLYGYTPFERKRDFLEQIFYISDELELPALSAENYIKSYSPFRPKFSTKAMESYLKMMNFTFDVRLDRLSMGNRKKFMIAFALASNPRLLMMDEPTNGLDIESKHALRKILAGMELSQTCVIISSHQVADIEDIISDVIILRDKGILLNASMDEIGEKLEFGSSATITEPLYTDGLKAIGRSEGEYSDVDLELLYVGLQRDENLRKEVSRIISKE